jgi:ubiquinone/menaquinone biosynthesis C-methylase UbiE
MGWYENSLFGPIAADIAAHAPTDATLLEVGCGSGPLSVRLAAEYGMDVTALDIDPGEIEQARERARRSAEAGNRTPMFLVGDVAHLAFEAAAFDFVVSTYSMHHWADKTAGLAEIARVLRPGGRALVWDLRRGFALFHLRAPDPLDGIADGPLVLLGITEWPWPFGFTFTRRLELARPDEED